MIMSVSRELFDRFWCFNFWMKALDVYFHPNLTAGPWHPYNRRNTAAAASYWQNIRRLIIHSEINGLST